MTVVALTWTLDEALIALLRGESDACLVCGEPVEGEVDRLECPACGSVLANAPPVVIPGQLTLGMEGGDVAR